MTIKVNLICDARCCSNEVELYDMPSEQDILGAGWHQHPGEEHDHYCDKCWPAVKKEIEAIRGEDLSETNSVETNQVERIVMLPCLFYGSTNLTPGFWSLDDGEVNSVECNNCHAGASVDAWNKRNEDA